MIDPFSKVSLSTERSKQEKQIYIMPSECTAHSVEVTRASLDCSKLLYFAKANLGLTRKATATCLLKTSKHLIDLTLLPLLA